MKIDQCLFGYDDGHRLLGSSLRLDGEVLSQLTLLSDLAPGVLFGASDGYWTGIPIPKLKRYALMRTWPAPEMSRPGCVWTHVLLLETSLFEYVEDLSVLRVHFRRPSSLGDLSSYSWAVPSDWVAPTLPQSLYKDLRLHRVAELLLGLYGEGNPPVFVSKPGELDELIFAIWSQQWPRLRRNFKFQTAATRGPTFSNVRFDLHLLLSRESAPVLAAQALVNEVPWIEVAVEDIIDHGNYRLRHFLRRYGSDVKRQRGSFRPLCEVFIEVLNSSFRLVRSDLPQLISRWFPSADDALSLKRDLVDGEILQENQLEFLDYVLKRDKGHSYPFPSQEGLERISNLWPLRSKEILDLADYVVSKENEVDSLIAASILSIIPAGSFWSVTAEYPKLRLRMIAARPDLLDSQELLNLDVGTISQLLEAIPVESSVLQRMLRRLLACTDVGVAKVALRRFPQAVATEITLALDEGRVRTLEPWLRALKDLPTAILDPAVMQRVKHTSTLFHIAQGFDWISSAVTSGGIQPWIVALEDAENDLSQDQTELLHAFFVALALVLGGSDSKNLFEMFFDSIHTRILEEKLSWKAKDILVPHLPWVGYRRGWDIGLRLRLGIVRVYVEYDLDPESFASLSSDSDVRTMLADAASEVMGGKRYAKAILS